MDFKKLFWIVFSVLIVVLCTSAYSQYGFRTSNMGMRYPNFGAIEPRKPYSIVQNTVSQSQLDSYRHEVEEYVNSAENYIKSADNDIDVIRSCQNSAINSANHAIDEFNSFVRSVNVRM